MSASIDDPRITRKLARPEERIEGRSAGITPELSILHADDQEAVHRSIKRAILGYFQGKVDIDMIYVPDGGKAIDKIKEGLHPDLIISDMMMPVMTGMDVYEWLQQNRPELLRRFYILSGGGRTQKTSQFLQQNKEIVLIKARGELDRIRNIIEEILKEKSA